MVVRCEECGREARCEREALLWFGLRATRQGLQAPATCRCCRGQHPTELILAAGLCCPHCGLVALSLEEQVNLFGYRYHSNTGHVTPQSWCRACRRR